MKLYDSQEVHGPNCRIRLPDSGRRRRMQILTVQDFAGVVSPYPRHRRRGEAEAAVAQTATGPPLMSRASEQKVEKSMTRLENKIAIITGGARGMGASHVRRFVHEGARVVFGDLREDEGRALAEELGEAVVFVRHDVTSSDDWSNIVETTTSTFGLPNVLVNNAGIGTTGPMEEMTEDQFRMVIDINLLGPWLGTKAVVPSMRAAGGGSIVNISSLAGLVGSPDASAYTASKFGVRGLTKATAVEFAKFGIRINSVHPGVIETPMVAESGLEYLDELAKAIPLGRIGTSQEVSNLVLYLAADESSYSTGSEFVIDAGLSAQ